MNSKKAPPLFVFLCLCIVASCVIDDPITRPEGPIQGYVPVYGEESRKQITLQPPRSVDQPGKIYFYNQYLLVNEQKRGIHVFNNEDPSQPENIGFIEILGNTDMAMKDNVLYADHLGQLVALEITNFTSFTERGRLPLSEWENGVPTPEHSYFECIDPSKGFVIGWRKATLKNPGCYAF
jgi:hypothetical protein